MNILNEDIIYPSDKHDIIKKVFSKSKFGFVNTLSLNDKEKKDFEIIMQRAKALCNNKSNIDDYIILHALVNGPDSNRNGHLNYLAKISDEIWKYAAKVNRILTWADNNEINLEINKTGIQYFNKSLYDRNDKDFEYAVKAFDAVKNNRSYYFNSSGKVTVDFEDVNTYVNLFGQGVISNISNRDNNTKIRTGTVEVDTKYFYSKRQESETDIIIPSGVNESDRKKRCIWTYIEIWSNASKNDDEVEKQRRSDAEKLNSVKKLLAKNKVSKEDSEAILKIFNDLT